MDSENSTKSIVSYCQRKHEKTPENTIGKNQCKKCNKDAQARHEKTEQCIIKRKEWAKSPKRKQYNKEYYRKNPDKYYFSRAKRIYGLSKENVQELYTIQNGKCAICGVPEIETGERLHIDHNHSTNQVRGLLCLQCNSFVVTTVEKYGHLIPIAQKYINRE